MKRARDRMDVGDVVLADGRKVLVRFPGLLMDYDE